MYPRVIIPLALLSSFLAACDKKEASSKDDQNPKIDMRNAVEASCGNLGMMIVRTRYAPTQKAGKKVMPVFSKNVDKKILAAADKMIKLAKEAQEKGAKRKAGEYGDFKRKVQDSILAAGRAVKLVAPAFFKDCEKELGPSIKECMGVLNPEKQRECMGKTKPKMVALVKKYDIQFKSSQEESK